MHNKFKLYVVSHTHWDREWYQTFQGFRKRLVFMMDELIDHMEKNEDFKYFHLDGQTIVLEDYLQIRPENEKRLKDLIQKGRIIIGPWYVMPDEFLLSGESLVRNIQKGFDISRAYGVEPMKCGYVIDIFGHNSQMPQIWQGFGIRSTMLYRGIGDYPRDAFTWVGADGTGILCLKLDNERSYSNFYFAIRWPFDAREYEKDELVSRMKELLKFSGERAVSDNLLMMDGVDHMEIEPRLTEIRSILNENIDGIELIHGTVEEYADAQRNSGANLEEINGELYHTARRGINNQVLKNVLSSMVHLKQMNNECETLLTRWAEPFDVIAGLVKGSDSSGAAGSAGFLNEAWSNLLKNHPHDSICGCSITRVHKDMEYRFNQVMDISHEVISMDFYKIASSINTASTGRENCIVLFNGSQKDHNGIVEVELEFPAGSEGNFKIFDGSGSEIPYQMLEARKNILRGTYRFRYLPDWPAVDYYRVAFNAFIPVVGYSIYGYEEYKNSPLEHGDYTFKEFYAPTRYRGTMQTGHRTWENEFLKVAIQDNGTFCVTSKETGKEYKDLLIFEDCADVGDGWNYRKPLRDSGYLSLDGKADISVEYDGPLAVKWKITHRMNLPVKMGENGFERSTDTAVFKITTFAEMRKGSALLEFNTFIDNNITEHRVRVLFPCYLDTGIFLASTPFFLQERNIYKNDWSNHVEIETGVYPNQGVVLLKDKKDSLALYDKGLYEVEITEDKSHSVALTLFRSFRNEVGRNMGEMSFMKRSMSFEFALDFKAGSAFTGDVMIEGEAWRTGIKALCTASHAGTLPDSASFLKVNIPGAVLSSFKAGKSGAYGLDGMTGKDNTAYNNGMACKDGMMVIRLYNCTAEATEGHIELYKAPHRICLLNLNEEIVKDIGHEGNRVSLKLNPAQIITLGVMM